MSPSEGPKLENLASAGPRGKDCADWRIGGLRIGAPSLRRFRTFGPPEAPLSWADSESAREMAQNAPLGSFRDQFRGLVLGPRSS
eukprot:7477846-Alexandrium_andersonii.AAC.1